MGQQRQQYEMKQRWNCRQSRCQGAVVAGGGTEGWGRVWVGALGCAARGEFSCGHQGTAALPQSQQSQLDNEEGSWAPRHPLSWPNWPSCRPSPVEVEHLLNEQCKLAWEADAVVLAHPAARQVACQLRLCLGCAWARQSDSPQRATLKQLTATKNARRHMSILRPQP